MLSLTALTAGEFSFGTSGENTIGTHSRAANSSRSSSGRRENAPPRRPCFAPFLAERVLAAAKTRRIIWGAGPTGRRLARELSRHGLQLHGFIDIDPAKIGRHAQGVPICAPETLDPARDFVIGAVGAEGARALIRADLDTRRFVEGEDCLFAA